MLVRIGHLAVHAGPAALHGRQGLADNTEVVASYPASRLGQAPVNLTISNQSASFVRTQVLDASGTTVAMSNPVWLLRATPPGGIPVAREA